METKLVILLGLVVVASGCSNMPFDAQLPVDQSDTKNSGDQRVNGKGLEIIELNAADNTLRPGQSTVITVTLKNYHTEDVSILENTFINTGQLNVTDRSCSPSKIREAKKDLRPVMQCEWDLKAPKSMDIGTEDKLKSITYYLKYDSSLTLASPLKLRFKEYDNVETTSTIKKSFSNGEVKGTLSVESPATLQGRQIDFTVKEVGSGRVASKYTFDFFPQTPKVFYGCPNDEAKEPIVGKKLEFSCTVRTDSPTTRNLYFSTYYKYAKEESLNINIVNE
ncbi:MAG: hypothetical protein ABEK00_00980 [Candidatus Nanohaloarchaea archaeon]